MRRVSRCAALGAAGMGSSQSSRSASPSYQGSYNVCAAPRQRAVKQLAAKAFDTPDAETYTPSVHKTLRANSGQPGPVTRRTRISESQSHSVAGKAVRNARGAMPTRPAPIDSIPTKLDPFDDSGSGSDSDAVDSVVQRRTRMPAVPSASSASAGASGTSSSSTMPYRGGSSLQRFGPENQRDVGSARPNPSSPSSSLLSKMGIGSTNRAGAKSKDAPHEGPYPKGTCDKCDGPHLTESCPIYKKPRENHRDAQRGKGPSMGKEGGNFKLKSARVIRQPGDGNCLFHSMAFGLGGTGAGALRREIAAFIREHPELEIAETPMRDWVKWDSGKSVSSYASSMAVSGWGGGIEMAACSHLKKVNVHVYERSMLGAYKRISCFDFDEKPGRKTLHVLYCGGVHYDALVP